MSSLSAASQDSPNSMCIEYATTRDPELRRAIIEGHQWLVEVCARQMIRRGEQFEDLVQVGNIGLIQAVDRFDPSFGVTFRTYASASIEGVLRRHYRSVWRVHVPRRVQELNRAVNHASETLTAELKRSPSPSEIAEHLGVPKADVVDAAEAGHGYWPMHRIPDDSDPAERFVTSDEDLVADDRADVWTMLSKLTPKGRTILFMRYYLDLTQSQIAEKVGISQVHVSRLIREAITDIRSTHERSQLQSNNAN